MSKINCFYLSVIGSCKCPKMYQTGSRLERMADFIFHDIFKMDKICSLIDNPEKKCDFQRSRKILI